MYFCERLVRSKNVSAKISIMFAIDFVGNKLIETYEMPFKIKYFLFYIVFILVSGTFYSCSEERLTSVGDYPAGKPFTFDTKIDLETKGQLSKIEKQELVDALPTYWADSMLTNKFRRYLFFYRIPYSPAFDTSYLSASKNLMRHYLNSKGYYHPTLIDSFYVDSTTDIAQKRVFAKMDIQTNEPTVIDSFGYDLKDPYLQALSEKSKANAAIIAGKTRYSRTPISNELDRLVKLYRNNGYFRMSKNNILAQVDTNAISLMKPTLNPFEQAINIAEAASKSQTHPTAKVLIMRRPSTDSLTQVSNSLAFRKYIVGRQLFFPEMSLLTTEDSMMSDTLHFEHHFVTKRGYTSIFDNEGKFVPRPMLEHIYLKPYATYSDAQYYRTINTLSQIGAWQDVSARYKIRQDSILDFYYFLTPAIKQNFTVDFEVSRNTGDFANVANFGTSASSLLGLGTNFSYHNRNAWKRAIQSTTTLNTGVQLNVGGDYVTKNILQTFQTSLGQTFVFPRFITPFHIRDRSSDGIKTVLGMSGTYQDRSQYFRLKSAVANWGYSWRNNNNWNWSFTPVNVEVYDLTKFAYLDSLFTYNPYLRTTFNTGTIISQQLNVSKAFADRNHPNNLNFIRGGIELSGGLLGLIKKLDRSIYQYVKIEGEYRRQMPLSPSTQLAYRLYAGIGINYASNNKFGNTLPFYKQFVAGGPNSMRGWALRQLGLGSSMVSDTSSTYRDRYGDMRLETNLEYRFPITKFGSMKVNGALFTDIGNIWMVRKDDALPNAEFKLSRLGKDLAVAAGTGVRLDFDYFLIRLDFGLKVKDPANPQNGGWMSIRHFSWRDKGYHVVNPISGNSIYKNNYAVQLGIGLPF